MRSRRYIGTVGGGGRMGKYYILHNVTKKKKNYDSNSMIGKKIYISNGRDAAVCVVRARIMRAEPRTKARRS